MHSSGIHTRMNSVIKHLLSPVTFSPFLQKLFERCDSLKQKRVVCVFCANFPLHRWHRLVYFSFIFNGEPCSLHFPFPPSDLSSCSLPPKVPLMARVNILTPRPQFIQHIPPWVESAIICARDSEKFFRVNFWKYMHDLNNPPFSPQGRAPKSLLFFPKHFVADVEITWTHQQITDSYYLQYLPAWQK